MTSYLLASGNEKYVSVHVISNNDQGIAGDGYD